MSSDNYIGEPLKNNVKEYRKKKNMSAEELAKASFKSKTTIHRIERGGTCHLMTKLTILSALGVATEDIADVFPGTTTPKSNLWNSLSYWEIIVEGEIENMPGTLAWRPDKDGYYLSPTCRICGDKGAAFISSEGLASDFADYAEKILIKRHGSGIELHLSENNGRYTERKFQKLTEKINEHSENIQELLEGRT